MPNVQRVQVSDYRLTANIVKTFLEEKFPAIIGSYNLTNDNGFYKFNIPVGTNWETTKDSLLKRRTTEDPYAPR